MDHRLQELYTLANHTFAFIPLFELFFDCLLNMYERHLVCVFLVTNGGDHVLIHSIMDITTLMSVSLTAGTCTGQKAHTNVFLQTQAAATASPYKAKLQTLKQQFH